MSRTTYFTFRFSDGFVHYSMAIEEAIHYAKSNNCQITHNGYEKSRVCISGKKDGFVAGYQPQLGEYVGGPREYARRLKEKGLVELGNSKISDYKVSKIQPRIDDSLAKEAHDLGIDLTDQEIDAINKREIKTVD